MTFESQALEQAGNEQLDKLAEEFDRWRLQKKSQAERIPESLIREARKLSEFIGASQVSKRLKLTQKQMSKLQAQNEPSQTTRAQSDFIKRTPQTVQPQEPSALRIDILTPQGMKISLSGFAEQNPMPSVCCRI
ncbi:MAG: hypothetical protein P8Y45_11085 [Exilibacterium sp.]